jgi:AAHS family 4-hydroxybenzoate transporter-like MFS transporter
VNAYLLAHYSWQSIFYAGGIVPLFLLPVLVTQLPESVRFLIARAKSPEQIKRIVHRLSPALVQASASSFVVTRQEVATDILLPKGRFSLSTLLLWAAAFAVFGALTVLTLWVPALLALRGMPGPSTAIVVGCNGFGALVGVGIAGFLLDRYGKTVLMIALLIATAAVVTSGMVGSELAAVLGLMTIAGFFVGVGASGIIALTVQLYPVAARARGLGGTMGASRFGQFVAPLVVGAMVADNYLVSTIFVAIAVFPTAGAIFLFGLRPTDGSYAKMTQAT